MFWEAPNGSPHFTYAHASVLRLSGLLLNFFLRHLDECSHYLLETLERRV